MIVADEGGVGPLIFRLDSDATDFARWLHRELGDAVLVLGSVCFVETIGPRTSPVPPPGPDARAEVAIWRLDARQAFVQLSTPPAPSRRPSGARHAVRLARLYFCCDTQDALRDALRPILARVADLHPEAAGAIRAWLLVWGDGVADAEDADDPDEQPSASALEQGRPLARRVADGGHAPQRPYLLAKWRMALPIIEALRRNGLSNRQISERLQRDHPDCAMSDKTISAVLRAADLGELAG